MLKYSGIPDHRDNYERNEESTWRHEQYKNSDSGNVPAVLMKNGSNKLHVTLKKIFQHSCNGNDALQEWRTCKIYLILNKGYQAPPENYRGISIICSVSRLYKTVLKNKSEE